MNKSVLIVTDQLPYPPRNGITLPIYHYATGLSSDHAVSICLFVDEDKGIDPDALAKNESIFGPISIISIKRRSRLSRLIRELISLEMFQHGWTLNKDKLPSGFSEKACIVSPMSAVAKWQATGLFRRFRFETSIAAVNDCTTAEYYFRGKQSFGGIRLFIKGAIDRTRSLLIRNIERKLLSPYAHVLLQTATDRQLMLRLVGETPARNVKLVPNGVRADLFSLKPDLSAGHVLFIAELSGEYAPIALWLVNEVWPRVIRSNSRSRFCIIGKGASQKLTSAILASSGITHTAFIDDISTAYRQSSIVLSPVFKGYGLINKTLEAMASGIPVVGGIPAFNGIRGFVNGRDGIACPSNSADEFAGEIIKLMSNSTLRQEIGESGRRLVHDQFHWEIATQRVKKLLNATT